ncbi:MAG TPA: septum formation initiator family protein [Pyrinomonadaceae bacterium]|nr:septum formation initiator family protein [Pyrinomonadaceae bacterium]
MKIIDNKYWLSNRHVTQRIAVQAFPGFATPNPSLTTVRILVRDWLAPIPAWIFLVMIILAVLGTASTVIVRMRSELQFSSQQYQRTASEIEILRRDNALLGTEIRRMTNDPSTIESVARSRLGMVRPNDIVVPTEAVERSNLGMLSLAR